MDAETRRFIVLEIERRLNIITSGTAGTNTNTKQTIENIYPGHPSIDERPIMHPYGFISRAKKGTIAVTAQQGSHPGNKMTLGHRDQSAPAVEVGESASYSDGGYAVRVFNGKIQIGKNGDYETVVVGETLKALLIAIIDAIVQHDHLGNLNFPTSTPRNASTFTEAKSNFVSNDKILAKDSGRY